MFGIGTVEIFIIAIVILLLFGGRKLPELTRGVTDAIREFRKALKDDEKNKEKNR